MGAESIRAGDIPGEPKVGEASGRLLMNLGSRERWPCYLWRFHHSGSC